MSTGEILKELKEYHKELRIKMLQLKAHRDRIEVAPWMDTKRLLSVSITQLETSCLYLKEAIEETERVPAQRYS